MSEHNQPIIARPAEQPSLQPVRSMDRIALLDILRGFALFGIFMVNMNFMRMPVQTVLLEPPLDIGSWDEAAKMISRIGFESKFYVLFSFMFGYGMALQMRRAEMDPKAFASRFARRCGWLLLFGLLHATLLWNGDILTSYALVGFSLLLFRKLPTWLLGFTAALLLLLSMLFTAAAAWLTAVLPELMNIPAVEANKSDLQLLRDVANNITLYSTGSILEIVQHRTIEWLVFVTPFTAIMMWPNILAMFLLGMVAARNNFLEANQKHRILHRLMWALGILFGIPLNFLAYDFDYSGHHDSSVVMAYLLNPLAAPAQSALYIVILITLSQNIWLQQRLSLLAPVGRMALTNYLGQSLITTLMFTSLGFGWMGGVGAMDGLRLVLLIFLLQLLFSHIWLHFFRFGPFEWVWRCLLYGKWYPITREPQLVSA